MPALHTSIQAVLSLYASGRTTGIVLDSGDGVSHAVPVYEGFAMPSAIRRIDVAGRDVTEHMQMLLRKGGHVFHTSAEKEVVRLIKEKLSYVSLDPKDEERGWGVRKTTDNMMVDYVLPDGNKLKVRPAAPMDLTIRWTAKLMQTNTGRSRALPRPGNSFQPGDNRARIPWCAPDRRRLHKPHRPRPAQVTVRQHCTLGRNHNDQGVRRSPAL